MKKFRKLMSMLLTSAMLASALMTLGGAAPAAAAGTDVSDEWDVIKDKGYIKTVISDESFDAGFELAPEGTSKNGVWERIGKEGTVEVKDGNVVIVPPYIPEEDLVSSANLAESTGIRFKYPARKGITVFAVTANRHGDRRQYGCSDTDTANSRNKLKLNVRFDAKNRYSYTSGHGAIAKWVGMDPAREKADGSNAVVEDDFNRSVTGYFMVQTGSTAVSRKYLNNGNWTDWYSRDAATDSAAALDKWDTLELYSNGAQLEIESVKIINYAPPANGKCYVNEDFEGLTATSGEALATELGGRNIGFFNDASYPKGDNLLIGKDENFSYLQLGTNGAGITGNAMLTIDNPALSLTELNNDASEYCIRMKLKAAAEMAEEKPKGNGVVLMYVWFGTNRFELHNTRVGNVLYNGNEKLVDQNKWTTVELHVKEGKGTLTIIRDGESKVLFKETTPGTGTFGNGHKFYVYGALCIDDLQIYTPGLEVQGLTDNGTSTEVTLYNGTTEKIENAKLILGGYNMDFLQDVQTLDVTLEPFETKTVTVPSLNTEKKTTERKLFLWDGFTDLIPLMEPYYYF